MKSNWYKVIFFISLTATIICSVLYNVIGSKVLQDGTLQEPFFLIPLTYIFALVTVIMGLIWITRK